jgi:hypothetical protein
MLRIRNNHEGFIDAHYSIHGRRAFVSSSSRMSNGFDNFSKHFGNGSNISFMQSHVFPREQIEWLDFLEVQFQSWLNDQEEDERHDRVLARKTRLPDLDYRDIDFVTKCDRLMRRGKRRIQWIPNSRGWAREAKHRRRHSQRSA